jgi:molecular chaperone HtpG
MDSETFAFSADINQLLSLIINTVYTNKDVFLREVVSNASDALNKIRYQSLTDVNCLDSESKLEIKISFDKENKLLVLEDTGIGMNYDDLIANLGTIASSGTKKFIESITSKDLQLIGQFGVGFYSVFLVADRVVVISKKNDHDQYTWESSGNGSFTIQKDEEKVLTRGTRITLQLKEDMLEYLEEQKIRELIKKHNQFIDFPIYIQTEKVVPVPETETEPETPKQEVQEKVVEFEHINKNRPLWCRNAKEVSEEEYSDFYKSLTGDFDTYLDVNHFSVEGNVEFKCLLYVPKRAPYDLFDGQSKRNTDMKLYVRRVFITDQFDELIPEYMKFMKGVIETDDVPLNLSRELLQQNKTIKLIGKNIVKKALDMFVNISNDADKFRTFYEQYSKNIKLGVHEDSVNREKLTTLLRYETSKSDGDLISLDEYLDNMQEGQTNIYYMTGESVTSLQNSPFVQHFKEKGIEVLYMVDPLDEYITQQVKDYKDKKLVCITKENGDFNLEESVKEEYKNVCDFFKSVLSEDIEKVVVSNRLANYPCLLSTSEYGWTANMQRLVKAQTFGKQDTMQFMMGKKILEINPNHEIIKKLRHKIESDSDIDNTKDLIKLLYEISLQSSGFNIENSSDFINRVLKLVNNNLE